MTAQQGLDLTGRDRTGDRGGVRAERLHAAAGEAAGPLPHPSRGTVDRDNPLAGDAGRQWAPCGVEHLPAGAAERLSQKHRALRRHPRRRGPGAARRTQERYEELAAASHRAAAGFVAGLGMEDYERFLAGLVPAARSPEPVAGAPRRPAPARCGGGFRGRLEHPDPPARTVRGPAALAPGGQVCPPPRP